MKRIRIWIHFWIRIRNEKNSWIRIRLKKLMRIYRPASVKNKLNNHSFCVARSELHHYPTVCAGNDAPQESILYSLVAGRTELIMFGGLRKDISVGTTRHQILNTFSLQKLFKKSKINTVNSQSDRFQPYQEYILQFF